MKVNDLINSFDWLDIKKNEPYVAFTNASDNSTLPWPDDLKNTASGQVNAFFRWKNVGDTAKNVALTLFLVSPADLNTKFEIPKEATADVTLRRLQNFQLQPGAPFQWTFGAAKGEGKADAQGLVTIPGLKITSEPTPLGITQ
jgi:hypothetical protein